MVDSETRLDNTVALSNNVFQYIYTTVNWTKEEVDTLELKSRIEPVIINNARTNPQMQYQRDNKVTLSYYYKDKNGEYLCCINVKPEDYK